MVSLECRYWSKEFIVTFLEAYRKRPCLWNQKCPDYTCRTMKKDAYDDLVKLCKLHNVEADEFIVKGKIQALRASFRKELRKVEHSIRIGGEVYRPKLWYYEHLLFTTDGILDGIDFKNEFFDADADIDYVDYGDSMSAIEESSLVREEKRNIEFVDSELVDLSEATVKEEIISDDDSSHEKEKRTGSSSSVRQEEELEDGQNGTPILKTTLLTSERIYNKEYSSANKSKRTLSDEERRVLMKRARYDEYAHVGYNVTAKLRKMNQTQAIIAEYLIGQILCKGLLIKLTDQTKISDG